MITNWSQIDHYMITNWSKFGHKLDTNWIQIGHCIYLRNRLKRNFAKKAKIFFAKNAKRLFLLAANPKPVPPTNLSLYLEQFNSFFFSSLSQKQRNKILKLTIFRTKNILSVSSVKNKNSIVIIFEKLIYINDNVIILMCRKNNMQTI